MSIPNRPAWNDIPGNINKGIDRVQGWTGWGSQPPNNNALIQRQIDNLKNQLEFQKNQITAINRKIEVLNYKFEAAKKEIDVLNMDVKRIWAELTAKAQAIASIKIDLELVKAAIKALPALITKIVWSILASAAFNALIYGIVSAFQSKQAQDVAREARDAWNLALKALGLAREAKNDGRAAATIAVKAEGKADKAFAEINFVTGRTLEAMKRLENFTKSEIKFLTESTRNALVKLQDRIKINEALFAGLKAQLEALKISVNAIQFQLGRLQEFVTGKLQELTNTIEALKTNLLKQIGNLKLDIGKIFGQLATFAAQIAGILLTIAGIQALLGRLSPRGNTVINNTYVTNNYDQRRTTVVNNPAPQPVDLTLLKKIDNTTTANLGISGANLQISTLMNNKLGAQLKDGLAGWMTRFTQWDIVNRAINLMTLAATIHNATMLSSAIVDTLIQSIQNIVTFFELKDSEGKGYDISELIKNSVSQFIKSIIGEANYATLTTTWKNANRIYQSATNLFSSLMSMGDAIVNALQVIGGQTGKIGNALRLWGVVGDKSFNWFNPQPNFSNPLLTKLGNYQEAASSVENVTQQPLTIKQEKENLETAAKEFADSLNQVDGSKPEGNPQPEPSKLKESADKSKEKIADFPTISLTDIFNSND